MGATNDRPFHTRPTPGRSSTDGRPNRFFRTSRSTLSDESRRLSQGSSASPNRGVTYRGFSGHNRPNFKQQL
jgi:hypothetical protein